MFKKLLISGFILIVGLTLVACGDNGLISITFEGVTRAEVAYESEFNILSGVRARGSDGQYYDTEIDFITISEAISEDGTLDTTAVGSHQVQYVVEGERFQRREAWRTIVVEAPDRPDEGLLLNGDFADGLLWWETFSQDSALIDATVTDGVMSAVVTAAGEAFNPRLTQMNIAFEEGVTYNIIYEARADVARNIQLQAGELLPDAPWFTEFASPHTQALTTEWVEYTWYFTHTQDNDRGGILFEFGAGASTTIQLRNIRIELRPSDAPDEINPVITGVLSDLIIPVGFDFDPLKDIRAFDDVDGDVTDDIELVITDSNNDVVESLDLDNEGSYTLSYSVSDAAGNEATAVSEIEIVDYEYSENLLDETDFSEDVLGEDTPWFIILQNWDAVHAEGSLTYNEAEETLDLEAINFGSLGAPYVVKLVYGGVTLEYGKTYLIEFEWSSTVSRDSAVTVGYNTEDNQYVAYAENKPFRLYDDGVTKGFYLFTVTAPTSEIVEIGFELGVTSDAHLGTYSLHSFSLKEADAPIIELRDELLLNGDFADGLEEWTVFWQDSATIDATVEEGIFTAVITASSEAFNPRLTQMNMPFEAGVTYTISYEARADIARDIQLQIGEVLEGAPWFTAFADPHTQAITTDWESYTLTFTHTQNNYSGGILFEFGAGEDTTIQLRNISVDEVVAD